ncbi:MAG: hypothetical protein ACSHWW_08520 [Nonlabens sp.]|uniref:hypothetical protein n=1 Tax=Nonlabens sp. TaxID=1888209 RepID=UPI003EF87867
MKTKQITYLLLACIVVLVTACNWPIGGHDDDVEPKEVPLVNECSDGNCPELDFSSNPSRIERSVAVTRDSLYGATHYAVHGDSLTDNSGVVYQDYREFNFNVENMRCYLKYIEEYGDSLGYTNIGLRAYIGSKDLGNGKIVSSIFFLPSGMPPSDPTAMQIYPVPPNIPGADGFNVSTSGMPPLGITNP